MPVLSEFYATHRSSRDKFEILAFHDTSAKTFEELDRELKTVRELQWAGDDLPFPILLDATGQTLENYGVTHFPTTVLIDPEGRLVGETGVEALAERLPPGIPRPIAEQIPRMLDRQVATSVNDGTLKAAIDALAKEAGIPMRLDEAALQERGVVPTTIVPLTLTGQLSLRSWLNLTLEAHRLQFTCGPEALVIGPRTTDSNTDGGAIAQDSGPQRICRERIEAKLREPTSFEFKDRSLAAVAEFFENATGENFILDPTARQGSRLHAGTKVTGSASDAPLGESLLRLLAQVEVTLVIRDELVVLTPRERPTALSK